jgi:rod shape-determining protein MreD
MKYAIYLLAIIILLGVNIGLFGNLPIRGQMPNLLLLLTVYFSVDKTNYDFFFIAFVCGLFLDCFSANFFGGWTFGFLVLALLLHSVSSQLLVFELNWKSLALLVLGAFTLVNFCLWLFALAAFKFGLAPSGIGIKVLVAGFLPGLFYNLLLLYPMYVVFDRLKSLIADFSVRSRGIVR